MQNYQIDIDGPLGDWSISKRWIKDVLDNHKGKPVLCRMNSLGGSLDHGLDIAERFANHGEVTVDMFSLNASAATIATLGAKTVRMSSSAFYLIHKVMNWVDLFDRVNADDIDRIIQELSDQKEDLQKMDLVIAGKYSAKTGKPVEEIMSLMKKGGWLTAAEAKEMGFVDEIIEAKEKPNLQNFANTAEKYGLPVNSINELPIFLNNQINESMKKQPVNLNALLGVPEMQSNDEGVYLNEDQVETIDTKVGELENSVATLTNNLTAANEKVTAAEAKVTEKETEITALLAQVENLKKGAGATTTAVVTAADGDNADPVNEFDYIQSARELFKAIS